MQRQESTGYQMCVRCVMDTTDPEISFDENGICNHCRNYEILHNESVLEGNKGEIALKSIINKIKIQGARHEYDCILGLSGGTDSTYTAYLAKKYGLNPLAVHLDNGWNSELSTDNIKNIVKKLGFDLYTYVIEWEEFKDLQLAYLKASVIDIEAITDHAILAVLHKEAAKNKIKYILSGTNIVTEGILPSSWIFNKMDAENIKSIHNHYGTKGLKTFPFLDKWLKQYYFKILKIETVSILNYVPYVKNDVMEIIKKELKWRDYGGKHYESVFTRFYQGYILPEKFRIDKRKAHLSTLICSGQLTKAQAVEELKKPVYAPELLRTDKEFVIKKFELTEEEFEKIMLAPVKKHTDFKTEGSIYKHYPLFKPFRPIINLIQKA